MAVYGVRWLATLLCLEVLTHTLYFNAVARFGLPAWRQAAAAGHPAVTPLLAALTGWYEYLQKRFCEYHSNLFLGLWNFLLSLLQVACSADNGLWAMLES